MGTKKRGQIERAPSSKSDELINSKTDGGKTELSEKELEDASGGLVFTFKLVAVKTVG